MQHYGRPEIPNGLIAMPRSWSARKSDNGMQSASGAMGRALVTKKFWNRESCNTQSQEDRRQYMGFSIYFLRNTGGATGIISSMTWSRADVTVNLRRTDWHAEV